MHPFKKMIFSTVNIIASTAVLEQGGISSASSADSANLCNVLLVDSICWFDTAVNGTISSGDIVYNDASGTNPVMGANQYYKVLLGSSRIVLINNAGVMTISTTCV